MQFVNQKCDCCDERAVGIEFSIEDLQQDEEGNLFLAFSEAELDTIYTAMTRTIAGTK
jgi:hypothetical protein